MSELSIQEPDLMGPVDDIGLRRRPLRRLLCEPNTDKFICLIRSDTSRQTQGDYSLHSAPTPPSRQDNTLRKQERGEPFWRQSTFSLDCCKIPFSTNTDTALIHLRHALKLADISAPRAMSELQRSWAKGRVGTLAEAFPVGLDTHEEDDAVPDLPEPITDDDSSSASSASSTGTIVPSPSQNLFARPQGCVSLCAPDERRRLPH
jgi:hypothetical protein